MTFKRRWSGGLLLAVVLLTLSACSEDKTEPSSTSNNTPESEQQTEMDHSTMNHSSSAEVPATLNKAEDPTFPVGSTALIKDGHMEGMKGAEATIVGAYKTTAYIISYNPTSGGERVENHKWIIHEELIDVGEAPLSSDTEVKTTATHMAGMKNATVRIEEAVPTTVYMVDYISTTNGETVKNHKWVTEDELTAQ
ncbi:MULTISPECIES: YdhK family protein [Lysinibacillus]|uniref:YdhK family protein n=1 Tax=Lysinibacillus TaxID=400634 RepID=UPI0004DEDF2A|nr:MULTISPECIES: YdhK family protein [Lysinibacillus]MBI6864115.1 YdhK family protein [Lysinibacillus fusiformis]QPA58389.1 YdhK family protein [Lysinibacillus sphaericus]